MVYIGLLLSILFWLICLFGITYFYYRSYRYKQYYNKIYPSLQSFIYEHILSGNSPAHFPIEQLQLPKDKPLVRKVIRQILREFNQAIGGEKGKAIGILFTQMGLYHQAISELKHASKNKAASICCLADLAEMELSLPAEIIEKLLNHQQVDIRVASYTYLLRTQGQDAFERVFDRLRAINSLDAIAIYQAVISSNYTGQAYAFHQWLSAQKTYASNALLLDLMIHYHESNEEALWQLMCSTSDKNVQKKVINTFGKLGISNSETRLQALYNESTDEQIHIEIIKALGRLGQGQSLTFLIQQFQQAEHSISLKKHLYKSILAQGRYNHSLVEKLEENLTADMHKLIQVASNPMTQYI